MKKSTDPVRLARSRVGVASRKGVLAKDPQRYVVAKRDLKTEVLKRQIVEAIHDEPAITDEQRAELTELLNASA